MNKTILLMVFVLALLPLVSSAQLIEPIQRGTDANLIQVCDNCTYVNITTVLSPNGIVLVTNKAMTKQGSFYNYTLTNTLELGTYTVTTCGDLNGINTCESYTFVVNPSGELDNGTVYIIVLLLIYAIVFVGIALKTEWIVILGGLGMMAFGTITVNNGIGNYFNTLTQVFSVITIGIGAIVSALAAISLIEDSYND